MFIDLTVQSFFLDLMFMFISVIITADEVIGAIDPSKIEIFQRYLDLTY